MHSALKSLEISTEEDFTEGIGKANLCIGDINNMIDNHKNAIKYFRISIQQLTKSKSYMELCRAYNYMSIIQFEVNQIDSAEHYMKITNKLSILHHNKNSEGYNNKYLGDLEMKKGNYEIAKKHYSQSMKMEYSFYQNIRPLILLSVRGICSQPCFFLFENQIDYLQVNFVSRFSNTCD